MSVAGISSSMSEDPSVPALMLRGLAVGGAFDDQPLEEGVMMRFLASSRSPYLSTGFIIWYGCLFICCGLPMLCCLISYICYKFRLHRRDSQQHMFISNLVDAWEATRQEREEAEIQLEIARIEANVTAFSIHQQKKRRAHLQQSWGEYRMIVGEDDLIDCGEKKEDLSLECSFEDLELSNCRLCLPAGKRKEQFVSPNCSICLERYEVDDPVVWSSNEACPHVFHDDCIASWLMTQVNPLCPCCRQEFINERTTKSLSNNKHNNTPLGPSENPGQHTQTTLHVQDEEFDINRDRGVHSVSTNVSQLNAMMSRETVWSSRTDERQTIINIEEGESMGDTQEIGTFEDSRAERISMEDYYQNNSDMESEDDDMDQVVICQDEGWNDHVGDHVDNIAENEQIER